MKLLKVSQAEQIILNTVKKPRISTVRAVEASKKILAENVLADRDQPSADRSSMDGIAVSFKAWRKGCREFHIEGVQKAGIPPKTLKETDGCFEVMTGAVIPAGCDCVIPIEGIKLFGRHALVNSGAEVERFQFIRKQGSEYKKDSLLLKSGTQLNATHISVAASVGMSKIKVYSPLIAVVGTGDELVEINKAVKPHQARRSNVYALETLFYSNGFSEVKKFHINDHLSALRKQLANIIREHDIIVLSGGVSMGKFDLIPQVLADLGVKVLFHKVSQKPGKPLWFGVNKNGKPVFALPGNPVSTLVCAARYVVPYLKTSCGITKNATVALSKPVKQNSMLIAYIPVALKADYSAVPVTIAGSGDYGALTKSAGFVEIPQGKGSLKKGMGVKFFSW